VKRQDVLIEADELLARIDDPNLRIYDATILFFRDEADPTAHDEYARRHIPGAAFFDHDAFSDTESQYMYMVLPAARLQEQIGAIGISEGAEVIFYTSGMLPCATRAWWVLRYAGHDNVRVLNGGLAAWERGGGRLEQGARHYEPTDFTGQMRPQMFTDKEEVLAAMDAGNVCTVNTLNEESYAQSHISGSSLLPCDHLMEEMARFLPDDVIAARLAAEARHERIITYCGGGIAATTNAIAHLIAGKENVAVYDGSMDEWAKEGLPLASAQA
jgi:thiosulfate/3-mercaptopyruvate sulfurtransferase